MIHRQIAQALSLKAVKIDIAAEREDVFADVDPPAELASISYFRSHAAVIEPRIKFDDHFHTVALAFDLPDEFMLRPKLAALVLFGRDRHEIGQHNFARLVGECRFKDIRLLEVTPRNFRIARRTDAPVPADSRIENPAEN